MDGRSRAWEAEAALRVWPRFSTLERWLGNGSVPGVEGGQAALWVHVAWQAGFHTVTIDFKPVSRGGSRLGLPEHGYRHVTSRTAPPQVASFDGSSALSTKCH